MTSNVKLHVRGCKEIESLQPFQKALHLRQHKCLTVFKAYHLRPSEPQKAPFSAKKKAYHLRDEVEQIELCTVVNPMANLECSNYLGPLLSK